MNNQSSQLRSLSIQVTRTQTPNEEDSSVVPAQSNPVDQSRLRRLSMFVVGVFKAISIPYDINCCRSSLHPVDAPHIENSEWDETIDTSCTLLKVASTNEFVNLMVFKLDPKKLKVSLCLF